MLLTVLGATGIQVSLNRMGSSIGTAVSNNPTLQRVLLVNSRPRSSNCRLFCQDAGWELWTGCPSRAPFEWWELVLSLDWWREATYFIPMAWFNCVTRSWTCCDCLACSRSGNFLLPLICFRAWLTIFLSSIEKRYFSWKKQKHTRARSYCIKKSSSTLFVLRTAHKRWYRRHECPNIDRWSYERGTTGSKNELRIAGRLHGFFDMLNSVNHSWFIILYCIVHLCCVVNSKIIKDKPSWWFCGNVDVEGLR